MDVQTDQFTHEQIYNRIYMVSITRLEGCLCLCKMLSLSDPSMLDV